MNSAGSISVRRLPDARQAAVLAVAVAAAALPSLLAYNASPSPTFLNQALAFALWAAFVAVSMPLWPQRGPGPLHAALSLLALASAWSWLHGALPASLGLSALATLAAAMLLVAGGAGARARGNAEQLFAAFCWAWAITGVLNIAIALIQVFLPDLPDGDWIAHSGLVGRAVGNLRQPNHLSSLLLWSCIAVVALLELGRLGRRTAAALLAALVFAVVLTASRTGLVSVLVLALWGVLDRRLAKPTRWLLLAAPLVYALSWLLMAQWAALSQHSFGGSERLAESDISSSRFAIWRDTLTLIRMHPWAGVGFGEFNIAWTLTPLPHRPVAFFDHTHNLLLQFAVELGLPLAVLLMGLLLWALWRGARNAWAGPAAATPVGTAQRCAMLMVLMIGLHSQLEYPLWYSYFLLPAAWAWGFALQATTGVAATAQQQPSSAAAPASRPSRALLVGSLVVIAGTALSLLDYVRVVTIFSADADAPPLEQRIAAGQRSIFFAHHADYAAVTSGVPVSDPAHAFDRAVHYLLDTRLMIAWARSLAGRGELDKARDLAERVREFRKPEAAEFFAWCPAKALAVGSPWVPASGPVAGALPSEPEGDGSTDAASSPAAEAGASAASAPAAAPFQCQLPQRTPPWRELLQH